MSSGVMFLSMANSLMFPKIPITAVTANIHKNYQAIRRLSAISL